MNKYIVAFTRQIKHFLYSVSKFLGCKIYNCHIFNFTLFFTSFIVIVPPNRNNKNNNGGFVHRISNTVFLSSCLDHTPCKYFNCSGCPVPVYGCSFSSSNSLSNFFEELRRGLFLATVHVLQLLLKILSHTLHSSSIRFKKSSNDSSFRILKVRPCLNILNTPSE